MAQQSKEISLKQENLPQTFCGANTDIGTIHNRVDHFYDAMRLQAISVKKEKNMKVLDLNFRIRICWH